MNTETTKAITETTIIASKDTKHTYEVIKELHNVEGETAVIILMYPTRTKENINSDDSTLNHLVNHMQEMKLKKVRIINLFSEVVNGKLSAKGLTVDSENMAYIESVLSDKSFQDCKFIIAWGTSMSTSHACQESKREVLQMFKKYCPKGKAFQISTSDERIEVEFPHPLFLGIRGKKSKWKLEEIKITQSMLKEQ